MTNTIPVLSCMRCGNDLLAKEIRAQEHHCEPCRKVMESAARTERQAQAIGRANRRVKL